MAIAEAAIAQILNAAVKLLTTTSKVAVIEDNNTRTPEDLDGRDIVTEVSGQTV